MVSAFTKHNVPFILVPAGLLVLCQYIKLSHPSAHQNVLHTSQHLRQETNIKWQGIRASLMSDIILSLPLNYVIFFFIPFLGLNKCKIINCSYITYQLFISLSLKIILSKISSLKTIFSVENYHALYMYLCNLNFCSKLQRMPRWKIEERKKQRQKVLESQNLHRS